MLQNIVNVTVRGVKSLEQESALANKECLHKRSEPELNTEKGKIKDGIAKG